MKIDAKTIVDRRRAERDALLGRARTFAGQLPPGMGVQAVVVFGSVARGDFNRWSDIDVLVVADSLPERFVDRFGALGPHAGLVQAVPWTPEEFRRQLVKGNALAVEAVEKGVWLVGEAEGLAQPFLAWPFRAP
jgi:predicted nucleotidyltransferase